MKLPVTKALRVASFPCLAMLLVAGGNAQTVPDIGRWSGNTALTQPQGFSMGSPLTLTWGFVPDATALGGGGISNLVSTFDATFGNGGGGSDLTNRPWFTPFASSFNRWSQLSGLSYQYSAADDGLAQDPNNPGSL
jgi:serralysin